MLQGKALVVQDNEAQALKERVETQGEGLDDVIGYLGMVPLYLELYYGVGYIKTVGPMHGQRASGHRVH